VTCRDIDGLIVSRLALASPEAAAHIAGCERCRRLAEAMRKTPAASAPSPRQLKQIETGVLADLKPVKPLAPAGALCFALLAILLVVVAVGAIALGIAGWRALSLPQKIAVFAAMSASICLLAWTAARQIVPGARLLLSPIWLVVAVWAILTGIFTILFRPHQEPTFVATGLICLRIGLECAVPSALAFWLLLRRGAILNPVMTGATAGALAGLSGLMVLEIFCPNLNEYHILAWHLGAALASTLGGIAVGSIAGSYGRRRLDVDRFDSSPTNR
jgi:hypothetical protein